MILETDPNTKYTNKIGMEMLYQSDITNSIKKIIEFNRNLCNSYAVIWEFCYKQLQNLIETKVEYETKIKDNLIELLESIKILIH